ncbi:NAD-dependent epimerase/dehydratase family protein [Arcobacter sp.]|uniref:NAD-dependent epimerase/dehydratase family protein n=1 Tax=Arcobacter sp. TaxID=1872629 RepID=UPI003C7096C5
MSTIIIIGKRSNLTLNLSKQLDKATVFSSSDKDNALKVFFNKKINCEKVNVIFNNFQTSRQLYDNNNLDKYIDNSIFSTSKILMQLDNAKVNIKKVIYTSSSSVYGNNKFCSETDAVMPMSLQAALKVANEELIKRFCDARDIDYTVARIFNMYGGEDEFSVISKIKNAHINNQSLNIINEGVAVRDYIHINDVVNVYLKLLEIETLPKTLNIASGNGKRVHDILNHLKLKGIQIQTINTKRDELKASIANTDLLNTFVNTTNFIQVEDFLLKELQ